MDVEDLQVYHFSMELGDKIWEMVRKWNYFEKETIGKQLVMAADSVAANISEGFGRYHFNDSKKFCYYSRGSLSETKTWLQKAKNRGLITSTIYDFFIIDINKIGKMLNCFIKSIGRY